MAAIAAAKKNAKGNKTAHVLNLLTAPGEAAPAPAESEEETPVQEETVQPAASRPLLPPILEVAQANDDSLAQQIQQALEEELTQEPPATEAPAPQPAPAPAAEAPTPAPAPAPAPSGGKMSQDDIEKMLAGMNAPAQEPAPAPAPAPSGGKMSQDDIEKMLAGMNAPAQEPAPAPVPSGGKMSQDDIEKMLAGMNAPAQEPAPAPAPSPSSGQLSQ